MSVNRICKGGLGRKGLQWATGALGLLPIGLAVFSVPVFAQIVPDNTLGNESSQVTPNVNIRGLPAERLDGGAVRGSALFHSFSEFNVNEGQRVFFSNPAGIADIFSRVTGSNVSNILGTLGVDGGANLFLLNPNGMLFGQNAQLDIGGSFLATTGNSFKFSDGSEFSATNPQAAPLLSINVTPGVQWGASQPGATITNRGNLKAGQDLTLAGGNLDLQGQLQAGRNLTLQAQDTVTVRDTVSSPFVATSGRNLTMQGNQSVDIFALNHPQSQLQSGGNFNLISDGNISGDAHFFSGGNLSMLTLSGTPGNFVSLFDPIIRANGDVQFGNYTGVALKVEATGSIQGGNIRITGPDATIPADDPDYATLTGSPSVILRAGLDSLSTPNLPQNGLGNPPTNFTGTSGLPLGITVGNIDTSISNGRNGGDIILSAAIGNIVTGDLNSSSSSSSVNSGNGGAIALTAGGNITTKGNLDSSSSSGNGGNITLNSIAGEINTTAGSLNSRSSSGKGGAIALTAQNNIQTGSLYATTRYGSGGDISLTSRNGEIKTNDEVSTATGYPAYSGGNITFQAKGNITIDSYTHSDGGDKGVSGAINITSETGNVTVNKAINSLNFGLKGGDINITAQAGSIFLRNSASLTSGNTYLATGNGGDINLNSQSLDLTGSQLNSDTSVSSNGGNLKITASNSVTLSGGSLSAKTSGSGRAGDITITTPTLKIKDTEVSTSTSGSGRGGNMTITTPNSLTLSGEGQLLAKTSGSGQAGQIEIKAQGGSVLLTDSSTLKTSSEAGATGNGGDILIDAGNLTLKQASSLDATTAGSGKAGNVTVNATERVDLQGGKIVTNILAGANVQSAQPSKITINAGQLSITEGGKISASVNAAAPTKNLPAGQGDAGNISIDVVRDTRISGTGSRIRNVLEAGAIGQGGTITLNTGSLIVDNDAAISASTSGTGNAGQVTVRAANGISLQQGGRISSAVRAGAVGNGGVINLESTSLTLSDHGKIETLSEKGSGTAGDVNITASTVTLNQDAKITAETDAGGSGNPANITLRNLNTLNLSNNSSISASTQTGQAGSINLNQGANPAASVSLNNSSISAQADGERGNAGGVTLNTSRLSLENGAKISARNVSGTSQDITLQGLNTLQLSNNSEISASTGTGKGGSVSVNAQGGTVALTGGSHIKSEAHGGQAGNLDITANQLRLRDRSSATVSSTGGGTAGKLAVSAPEVILENSARLAATTEKGSGGDIQLQNLSSLRLNNGSEISASTQNGKGGSISVMAPRGAVALTGNSSLKAEATQGGQAGNLEITANQLRLRDRSSATVSSTGGGTAGKLALSAPEVILEYSAKLAATTEKGSGGDIQLQNLSSLQLSNGSEISASTQSGTGGNMSVNAPGGTITLTDKSSLKAEATEGGQAGNLQITANQLTLREGSQATVSSRQGQAGNLSVTANNLLLDTGEIKAETGKRSEQGGANINLQVTDLLLLRHRSLISANATGDANGGNITISAPFVVAVPSENNDIIANAFSGDGGQIKITNNYRVFGLKPQSRQSFDTLRQNRTSDISASSQSGNQGIINIQSLSVDPSQGLTALPVDIIDPSQQIANRCGAGNSKSANGQGEFVVTGRGGLPPSPDDMQTSGAIAPSWVTRDGGNSRRSAAPVKPPATPSTPPLVEAQGMFINAKGEVVLTAQTPTTTPHQPGIAEPVCSPATNENE